MALPEHLLECLLPEHLLEYLLPAATAGAVVVLTDVSTKACNEKPHETHGRCPPGLGDV